MKKASILIIILTISSMVLASCANRNEINNEENSKNKPTVPENVAEGITYLYDFRFSERYDANVTDDFSLALSGEVGPISDTLFLFAKYQNEVNDVKEYQYDSDGMTPYMHKRYMYACIWI